MEENFFTNIKSKERSSNFSKAEMDRLQLLVAKYKNILFCKKTDGISSKQKESAWHLIEGEFNALGDTPRTIKQLKYKFENLKRVARKEACKERQEMRRTGGGALPPPLPSSEDAADWLRSIMPSSIDGYKAIYDDDTLSETIIFPAKKPDINHNINIEIIDECITEESQLSKKVPANEIFFVEIKAATENEFDASTPYSSLKIPISSPLRRRVKKKRTEEDGNLVRQLLREKKISVMDKLQPRVKKN